MAYATAVDLDKAALNIQAMIEQKRKLIKETYKDLLVNVKDNPYLKTPITHYEARFAKANSQQKKQIALLKKHMLEVEPADRDEFLREIKYLEKQLL